MNFGHSGHIWRIICKVFTVAKKAPNKVRIILLLYISAENNAAKSIVFFEAIKKVNLPEFMGFRHIILSDVWCITHSALLQMCLNYSVSETASLSSHPPTSRHICTNGLITKIVLKNQDFITLTNTKCDTI
jgi:hypothetical protein